ncbi:MAG: HAMP domain-containing protein, partial [Planctomycetota bacterium]|nr:HAMP domain-containing protein [Planctomycetota bacterium]
MAAKGDRPSPSRNRAASSRMAASSKSAAGGGRRAGSARPNKGNKSGKAPASNAKPKGKRGKTSGQKTQKAPARRGASKDKGGLQAIPTPKVGFPLWIKFAIPTAFIIALLLVVEGLFVSQQMVQEIELQINKRGVDLVTQLAQNAPRELWLKEQPADMEELPEGADMESKKRYAQMVRNRNIEMKKTLRKRVSEALADTALKANKANEGSEIRAMLLLNYDVSETTADPLASSVGVDQKTSLQTNGAPQKRGEVRIYRGTLGDAEVREFRLPVMDDGTDKQIKSYLSEGNVGWASVFLDAAAIEQVRKKTNKNILIITIIGAIASVIIIVLIATLFTRPIRQLQADVTKVAEGNLGHRTTVSTNDEIGALATVSDVMTSNLRAAQAQEADRKAIERELS